MKSERLTALRPQLQTWVEITETVPLAPRDGLALGQAHHRDPCDLTWLEDLECPQYNRERGKMNTLRWLAVVAFLAIVLAVANAIFGDSPVAMAVYFAACLTTIHVLLGRGPWYGIPPAALIATGIILTFKHAIAADSAAALWGWSC